MKQLPIITGASIILSMTGCTEIAKLQEDIAAITNEFVIAGVILGTEDFQSDLVDMDAVEMGMGASQLFLASAMAGSSDLDPNPVTRANPMLDSNSNDQLAYTEEGSGFYSLLAEDGLTYVDNEVVSISVDSDGAHAISTTLPLAADYDIADSQVANTDLVIDLTGQGFDSYLVAVTRFPGGEVVYSNEPNEFADIYHLANPTDALTTVTIPGATFAEQGVYVVALAALVSTDSTQMDNVNVVLSSLLAGKTAFDVTCVPDCVTVAASNQ